MYSEQRLIPVKWLRSWMGMVVLVFLAITGFFLVTEHTAHFFGVFPYLLLLLCPLLHLFMHGSHGSHGGHPESSRLSRHIENSQQNPEGSKQ